MDASPPTTVPIEALELLTKLTPDLIRARLAELEGERKCLMALLRARLAFDRAAARPPGPARFSLTPAGEGG